jgi:hypothetical protein
VPTGTPTRLIASAFFVCLLTGSAWANGIKHPSDYGSPPGINLLPCATATQTVDGVVASCFQGSGLSPNDFLFTLALANPSPSTSISSVTFNFSDLADVPTDFGLIEGTNTDPCSGMNVACLQPPTLVTITDGTPLGIGDNKFLFSNFTGDLSGKVTAYFSYGDSEQAPSFTAATTSSTTATPEPGELGLLTVALASLILVRRR